MTARRIPVFATIVVLAAAATMIALGFWQLDRKAEKDALLARYEAVIQRHNSAPVDHSFADEDRWYRPAIFLCEEVSSIAKRAGRSATGRAGWAYVARCITGGPASYAPVKLPDYVLEPVDVTIGWSEALADVEWSGGEVTGRVAPRGEEWGRVVANPPLAGLEPSATPNPRDLPNNHLSYAVQWFFFAATALVIYALALRKRWRGD